MTDLLPCPFCGEKERLYPSYRKLGKEGPYSIDCLGCGMDFVPRDGADVIAAWNRRAPDPRIEALTSELAEARKERDVKPLIWEGDFAATNIGIFYSLTTHRGNVPIVLVVREGGVTHRLFFKTREEAKAAAQADYEQRIRSALASPALEADHFCTEKPCDICGKGRCATTNPTAQHRAELVRRLQQRDKGFNKLEGQAASAIEGMIAREKALLSRIEALTSELAEAQRVRRWSIDAAGETLAVCEGDHDKGEKCEWKTYVPLARAEAAEAKIKALEDALTPSGDTKAAYIGEFSFGVTLRAGNQEDYRRIEVPWTVIKEIMAAIRARAAATLGGQKDD